MNLSAFLLVTLALVSCEAETPSEGPYSPSGWRPSGPSLPLPGEYGAPPLAGLQVSQENVQFAGQTVEVPAAPASLYLPPRSFQSARLQAAPVSRVTITHRGPQNNLFLSSEKNVKVDPLRVQNLPRLSPPKPFRSNRLNTGEVLQPPRRPAVPFAKLQRRPADGRILSAKQQASFFAQQPSLFTAQQQLPLPDPAYGAPTEQPQPSFPYAPPAQVDPQTNVDNSPPADVSPEEASSEENGNDGPVIAVANAQTTGQYYILGKDNTLQRVVYETTQNEEDIESNGFTAQLKYEPVEPIRDPIYAYDDNGKLVRIYNKK